MGATHRRREDILVSLCFSGVSEQATAVAAVQSGAKKINRDYRFWELVVVVDAELATTEFTDALIALAPNIRVIKVASGTSFYRQRVIAASESIGDVALLSDPDEIEAVDLKMLIELAQETGAAVSCSTSNGRTEGWVNRSLSAISGFSVSPSNTLTVCYPRAWINRIQKHPERDLAMRFPPRNASFPYRLVPITTAQKRSMRDIGRRAGLIYRLLVNIAPKLLPVTAFIAFVVAVLGVSYLLYAVGVIILLENVAEGWFSTAAVQSAIAFFLGMALFGIVMGLQKVLDLLEPEIDTAVVDEVSNVDLFNQVMSDLNIETENMTNTTTEKITLITDVSKKIPQNNTF